MAKTKKVKEVVNTFWTVENKDGYRVIVTAPNRSIARSLGVSKLFNLGKNPNIATITN